MNTTDIHLRFSSEQEANELLLRSGVWRNIGIDADGCMTDVIGLIQKETGQMELDEAGNMMPMAEVVSGWHINMRGKVPDEIKPHVIKVKTPLRIWD